MMSTTPERLTALQEVVRTVFLKQERLRTTLVLYAGGLPVYGDIHNISSVMRPEAVRQSCVKYNAEAYALTGEGVARGKRIVSIIYVERSGEVWGYMALPSMARNRRLLSPWRENESLTSNMVIQW